MFRVPVSRWIPKLPLRASLTTQSFPLSPFPDVKILATQTSQWSGDVVVLPLFSSSQKNTEVNTTTLSKEASELDSLLDGSVEKLLFEYEFSGKEGEVVTMHINRDNLRKIALVGMGEKRPGFETRLGETLVRVAKDEKCSDMTIAMPTEGRVKQAVQGLMGGLYCDNRFRTGTNVEKALKLKQVLFQTKENEDGEICDGLHLAKGSALCRDLVNAPANSLNPKSMADLASDLATETGLDCEILEKDQIVALGMGAYLGVAQGSEPGDSDPRFIHLTYNPTGSVKSRVALVGKGLTFDSGGYNLKVAGSQIEKMKFDMGGAGAVLGAAQAVGLMKPQGVSVHFIVAACENMVSDRAMRPGDVLTASNGKTIEVINTDAEGRLTLADALVYAEKLKVDTIVDVATLTGACVVSLGEKVAGLWSSDDSLADSLSESSATSGEKVWRMPLEGEYKEQTKSTIADLTNCGPRSGGAITAALFLKEFVSDDTPWAHLDIAGPVWGEKGASGFGVKLLVDYITKLGHS